jgi:exopolysaccharide biosynthesis polyprenyl glycosylphosphotransferase
VQRDVVQQEVARRGRSDWARADEQGRRGSSTNPTGSAPSGRGGPVPSGQYERAMLTATDLAIIGIASFVAGSAWVAALIHAVGAAAAFAAVTLYRPRLRYSALDDLPQIVVGVGVVFPLGAWLAVADLLTPPAFAALPIAWPIAAVASVFTGRAIMYSGLHGRRRRLAGRRTVVIGTGDVAIRIAEALRDDRTFGLQPVGMVGDAPLTEPALPAPLLGGVSDVDRLLAESRAESVIVAFAGRSDADLVATLRGCRGRGLPVYVVPRLFEMAVGRCGAELVSGVPVVRMRPEAQRRWCRAVKRALDIAGAGLGLVVLAPVFVLCALAVRWEAGAAGIVFRQERIGRGGKPFTIMKFRSLTPSSNLESQMRWNIRDDDRVGPIGRLLRSTSLDELPQLVNVLKGEMSLVGPRPERPYFVEQFGRMFAGYVDRHRMAGGITGWAQIHGLRGDTSISDRVRFDNYYIENWSIGLDLKIIIRTIGSMLSIVRR